jgi:hypothetical protein
LIGDNGYRKRILKFMDTVRPMRKTKEPSRGMINVAMVSMQAMQDTIATLRMSTYSPDVLTASSVLWMASSAPIWPKRRHLRMSLI